MTFVLDPTGLTIPTQTEIFDDVAADMKANVDPLLNTAPDSIDGQEIGIVSSHLRELWEAVQAGFDSIDPDNAEDERLDVVCSITGTTRDPATASSFGGTHRATVNLNAGKTLSAGALASVVGNPAIVFRTTEDVTNSGGSPANVPVAMVCTQTGPIPCNAGTLTVIASPQTGWNSVTNAFDAELGTNTELDVPLRGRRENELRKAGTSNPDAIRASLLAFKNADGSNPIRDVSVLNNTTLLPVNGVPPKAFECVIWDGPSLDAANADIAATIFASQPLGIQAYGATTVVVTDAGGNPQPVGFTRVTQRVLTVRVTFNYNAKTYPGDTALKTALAAAVNDRGSGQKVGQKVSFAQWLAFVQTSPGVRQVELWEMHLDGGGYVSNTDLTLASREIAQLDTSNIFPIGSAT